MTPSPLHDHFDSLDASFMPYGQQAQIVAQFASVEVEYAAIRKAVAMMDCPQRGLLRVTGKDRLDFLHRMLTQDCNTLKPGDVRRAFLLNAKGRIMADLIIMHGETQTLLDVDVHDAGAVAAELDKMLFGEDVQIENLTQTRHRISLHGPKAAETLAWWKESHPQSAEAWTFQYDETGEAGLHIWMPPELAKSWTQHGETLATKFRFKMIGWLAFNIARIEAGRPLFHIDFGPDSLPHETGAEVLAEAVSFTKGCYRGQEIVARMQSLGHPAKLLVGFRAADPEHLTDLPVAGVAVHDRPTTDPEAAIVGGVTSSANAPMMSQTAVGFTMVKWAKRDAGTTLYAPAAGRSLAIAVVPMKTYPRPIVNAGSTP